jgi:nicotinamidase/pyrazinamidase
MRKTAKKMLKLFLMLAALLAGILALLITAGAWISAPTKGEKIARYNAPRKALLVIDIQEDYTGTAAKPPFPYRNARAKIDTVNSVIRAAADRGMPIAYIRMELSGFMGGLLSRTIGGGTALKGAPGTAIDGRVLILSDDEFPKPRSDAFANPELESFLIRNRVNELVLVGLDADGCVHATARGALNRGYGVTAVTDGLFLREEKKWGALKKKYGEEGIRLTTSREFGATRPARPLTEKRAL